MEFKYGIGQALTTKESMEMVNSGFLALEVEIDDRLREPIRMDVVERRLVECSGGVQIYYTCSHRIEGGKFTTTIFNEFLLVPYPKELVQKIQLDALNRRKEKLNKYR